TVEVIGNTISNIGQDPGIFANDHGDGAGPSTDSPVLDITIKNNKVALVNNGQTGGGFLGATTGIAVPAGATTGDLAITRALISGNQVTTSGTQFNGSDNVAFLLREGSSTSQLFLDGTVTGANNQARATNYWNANGNTPANSAVAFDAGGAPAYATIPAGQN